MIFQKPSHTFSKIHLKALGIDQYKILFSLSFTVFVNTFSFSQDIPKNGEQVNISIKDTLAIPSIKQKDLVSNEKVQDTVPKDSTKQKKDLIENIVKYFAKDYTTFSQKKQQLHLYNEAKIDYGDMNITAGSITIDYIKNTVYAKGIVDSSGIYTQKPVFTQSSNVVEPDSIIFNTETQKSLIYNSKSEQGEGTVIASVTKKENDSVFFVKNAKYTTSENLDDPEYYFKLRKAKIVPGKKIVTGLTNLFIYDVPTPLGLPFGFFPQSQKQTSGVIIPTFGDQNDRGYFLQNGGYYFAISDYLDLAVLGDYYTNGSYGLRIDNTYAQRYKYRGNVGFRYENNINSDRGFPDYSVNSLYNFRWSHSQDAKANPSSRFSASVNLGSSTYYRQSVNQVNIGATLNNTLASSISYSKTFQGLPQVNYSLTATHSQNTNTETINMTLPTLQASVGRMYPFASKTGSKKGIIENVNLQYNLRGENRIQTTDDLFFKSGMFDDAKMGLQHSIPINTNFKILKHFSISASSNFNEVWAFKTIEKSFDAMEQEQVDKTINGFDAFRTYNFSTSLGTTLYGMFNFEKEGKDAKIKAIRHVMRPSINYNINPAFDRYYENAEIVNADGLTQGELDVALGNQNLEYTRFQESIFGTPNKTYSSSMGISLSNNLEAKVRDKDSTATKAKKIILLNNFNLSTAYNFAGDSLQWSAVRMNGGTQLFKNKMSINFNASLDPYALDNNNNRIDKFNINNNGSLFRLTSASANASWSFSSRKNKSKKEDPNIQENIRSGGRADDLFGVSQDFANQQMRKNDDEEDENESELYNYKIPWDFRVAYAVNYSNGRRQNEISSHSLMFSGDVQLSSKWSIGGSSGYDMKNLGITQTQLRFQRNLESWNMNFSWVPFGPVANWNFFIGISSSMLSDLKYEKRRQPDIRL